MNPKDWKASEQLGLSINPGDDMAGVVEAIGSEVVEFKKGDRVAALHRNFTPNGSFAEFSLAPSYAAFKISERTAFEEAAVIPLATMTAGLALFRRLGLPAPWCVTSETPASGPLLVYGASGAVGSSAVQLAARAGLHPIIAIAGKSCDYVQTIINPSKGDIVLDYREGVDAVVSKVKEALGGKAVYYAFDCVSENGSDKFVGRLLKTDEPERCKVATVLPRSVSEIKSLKVPDTVKFETMGGIPPNVKVTWSNLGAIHGEEKDFGYVFFRYMGKGVQEGWLKAMPRKLVDGGLDGVPKALRDMKDGVVSATKYVVRVGDTASIIGN